MVRYFYSLMPLVVVAAVAFLLLPWLALIALAVLALAMLATVAALTWAVIALSSAVGRSIRYHWPSRSHARPARATVLTHVTSQPLPARVAVLARPPSERDRWS